MFNYITEIYEVVEIKKVFVGRVCLENDGSCEIELASLCGRHVKKFMNFGTRVIMDEGRLVIVHERGYVPVLPQNEEEVLEAEKSGEIYRKPLHEIFHFMKEID